MISGPVILPLSEAVSAVESASRSAQPSSEADEALLQTTLSINISPEDIRSSEFAQDLAEKQADEMTAASQRSPVEMAMCLHRGLRRRA